MITAKQAKDFKKGLLFIHADLTNQIDDLTDKKIQKELYTQVNDAMWPFGIKDKEFTNDTIIEANRSLYELSQKIFQYKIELIHE